MTSFDKLSPPLVDALHFSLLAASHDTNIKRSYRNTLKTKQSIQRLKCNRALKRKLKKYKLRQDGQEDQDILDISDVLVTSLVIRTPNKDKEIVTHSGECELLRPKNYLFKMISKKQVSNTFIKSQNFNIMENLNDEYPNSHERKQMNAFKLLMDSRNKIVGRNLSGKEKIVDETHIQEVIVNKNVKTKRMVVLQKMAEGKGSLKEKEKEKYKDKCIQITLEKRVERFKSMLSSQESKKLNGDKSIEIYSSVNENMENSTNNQCFTKSSKKETKALQWINIFTQSENLNNGDQVKKEQIIKEDQNFRKKISTSLKKKENMLNYLKKNDNAPLYSCDPEYENKTIKVKITQKSKNKRKKRKLSVNEETNLDHSGKDDESILSSDEDIFSLKYKNKQRIHNFQQTTTSNKYDTKINRNVSNNRPKRTIKKPVKCLEKIYQSSSDEELHIFTPKKRKQIDNCQITSGIISNSNTIHQNTEIMSKSVNLNKIKNNMNFNRKSEKNTNVVKKPIKLAPIFNCKQNFDMVAVEAKQKFLQSGVPDKLKKLTFQQQRQSVFISSFATVVHVQQRDNAFINITTKYDDLFKSYSDKDIISSTIYTENLLQTMLNLTYCHYTKKDQCINNTNVKDVLHYLKEINPRFPVYRTYRMLRGKRKGDFKEYTHNDLNDSKEVIEGILDTSVENPDQLSWSDKYQATSTNHIIGNFGSINELKKWLVSWNENYVKTLNTNADSDLSDFYNSDSDSMDNLRNGNNLIILSGPVGSGKTSSVYAVAAELSIKVIEVNVSNKRTGKIMLQDLQEATQSHKVNRGASTSDNLQKFQEGVDTNVSTKVKKRGRPKKFPVKSNKLEPAVTFENVSVLPTNQDVTRTDSSLILIDDADIVFDQDDGFCSAIVQLTHCSKRPVILVISSLSCLHLQRFLQNVKILRMNPLSPKILGTWLDIMSLADMGLCFPGAGSKLLNYFKGDMRKSINTLQFYMSTLSPPMLNEEIDLQTITNTPNSESENSNISWFNSEDSKESNQVIYNKLPVSDTNYIWNHYIRPECNLLYLQHPLKPFNIWWSLYSLITNTNKTIEKDNHSSSLELRSVANAIDSISLLDYFNHSTKKTTMDLTSSPWSSSEMDNVTEVEDISYYVKGYETNEEICCELVKKSIIAAQKVMDVKNKYDIDSPGMGIHSERDKIVSRHNNLSSYLNPSAVMDRRSLAVDYWSFCRTLCKVEKNKSNMQTKRRNRFCHYLKSVNILCKNEAFEHFSSSLSFNKE